MAEVLEARIRTMRNIVEQSARDYNTTKLKGDKRLFIGSTDIIDAANVMKP